MRKIVFAVIGLMLLLILAAVIIPFLIPSSVYKTAIQDQLSERLGRSVEISGDINISPLPSLKVKVGAVNIENPEGYSSEHFAQIEQLNTRIKLLPLISKRVEIASFELLSPVIDLEKRADGETNWVLGAKEDQVQTAGPFKRDGRYADLDATIGRLIISDGAINYSDLQAGRDHKLTDVNLQLSMPSLRETLSASGNLVVDGISTDLDITMKTPRLFLDGAKTPVEFKFETPFGNIAAKGYFTESPDIHFALDVKGMLSELKPLATFLPDDSNIPELAQTIGFSGNYTFDGKKIDATGADIAISGPVLNTRFIGDAVFSESLGGTGKVDINIADFPKLTKLLDLDTPVNDVIETAVIKSDIRLDGETIVTENLVANVKGQDVSAEFNGQGSFGDKTAFSGSFSTAVASIPKLASMMELGQPQLSALGDGKATGTIDYNGQDTIIKLDKAQTSGPNLTAEYTGKITLSDAKMTLAGNFDSQVPSVLQLAQTAQIDIPYAAAVGSANASGQISGTPENLRFDDISAVLSGGEVNGSYQGSASIKEETGYKIDGKFDGTIAELSRLAEVTGQDIPYAQSIGRIETKGNVSGASNNLDIDAMQITLSEGELNGSFNGRASVKDGFKLDGQLDAEIPSARKLTRTTTGVELPASTKTGQIYERVAFSGQVTGNPAELRFTESDLSMDALQGGGVFKLDLTTEKPTLTGTLDMGQIDLRPYMAAYSAGAEGIQPWSDILYNFSALNLMDGNYILKTPEVIFGPLTFGETDLNTVVKNGVMTARLPEINLYGGLGVLTATLDASGEIPKVRLAVTLEDIKSNRFLGSLANFTKLEGNGHTLLELTGEGRNQAEIMRSLDGYGDFEVIGGVIKGIDLSKFLTGVDESLTQRILPQGLGQNYATDFDDLVGKFKIQDGVISIESFNLKALGVHAGGSGTLDIGNQKVDFGLRPRLTSTGASDIGRFGVPIRFKGDWGNISPGPDFDLLQKIAIEKAKIRAREEITERVGGQVGNVIGGIFGVPKEESSEPVEEVPDPLPTESTESPDAQPTAETASPEPTEAETEAPSEETVEPETSDQTETPVDTTEEKPIEEQIIENAIDGLFGGKEDKSDD